MGVGGGEHGPSEGRSKQSPGGPPGPERSRQRRPSLRQSPPKLGRGGTGWRACAASSLSRTCAPDPQRPSWEPRARVPPGTCWPSFVLSSRHKLSWTPHQVSARVRSKSKDFGKDQSVPSPPPHSCPQPRSTAGSGERRQVGQWSLCRCL